MFQHQHQQHTNVQCDTEWCQTLGEEPGRMNHIPPSPCQIDGMLRYVRILSSCGGLVQVGSYAPGGLLGFERSRAHRHPISVYEKLRRSAPVFGGNHLVIERLWAMLFAGSDFHDPPLRVLP